MHWGQQAQSYHHYLLPPSQKISQIRALEYCRSGFLNIRLWFSLTLQESKQWEKIPFLRKQRWNSSNQSGKQRRKNQSQQKQLKHASSTIEHQDSKAEERKVLVNTHNRSNHSSTKTKKIPSILRARNSTIYACISNPTQRRKNSIRSRNVGRIGECRLRVCTAA